MERSKRIGYIIILMAFILTYFALAGISFAKAYKTEYENVLEVVIDITGEKNLKSKANEIRILKLECGQELVNLEDLSGYMDGNIVYQDGMLLARTGKIVISIRSVEGISVLFLKHAWSGIVRVRIDQLGIDEEIDCYSPTDNTVSWSYNWDSRKMWKSAFEMKSLKAPEYIILFVLIFAINMVCLVGIKRFYVMILEEKLRAVNIAEMMISSFIIGLLSLYVLCKIFGGGVMFFAIVPVFVFIVRNRRNLEGKIYYLYAILFGVFSIFVIFLLPPGHVPDEYSHFIKVYEASVVGDSHTTLREGEEFRGKVFIYLPEAIRKMEGQFMVDNSSYNVKYDLDNYFKLYYRGINNKKIDEEYFWFGNTANLNSAAYIMDIPLQRIMNFLSLPASICIQIIRCFHALVYALVGYILLKKLTNYRRIFFVIMLLPIVVQQSVGINQDWLTNLTAFVFVGAVLMIKEKEKFTLRDFIFLCSLSFLLGNLKAGYFAVCFFVFILPRGQFGSRKTEWVCKVGILAPCILLTAGVYFNAAGTIVSEGELPFYSIGFILNHPFRTMNIYLDTFEKYGIYSITNGLISGFGWYTHYAGDFLVSLMGTAEIILLLSSNEKGSKTEAGLGIINYIIIVLFVFTSMFLSWTTVDSSIVCGLQPRYFIVALLCLSIGIQNKKLRLELKYKNIFYAGYSFACLSLCIFTLMGFYS